MSPAKVVYQTEDRRYTEVVHDTTEGIHQSLGTKSPENSHQARTATSAARKPKPAPLSEEGRSKKLAVTRRHRIQTWIAQAFILFNAYGIPLSYGPYLEYYFTITFYKKPSLLGPVLTVSSIIAVQIFCIFGTEIPALMLYQRKYWRITPVVASVITCASRWTLLACERWWVLLLVEGFGVGTSLGLLQAVGTLCLASHYQNNHPLASMTSISAGLVGAMIYTGVAFACLSTSSIQKAYVVNAAITTVTLILACILIRSSNQGCDDRDDTDYRRLKAAMPSPNHRNPLSERGTVLFIIGYVLLFSGLFIYPIYSILLISASSSSSSLSTFPTTPTWHLFFTYITAAISAPFAADKYLRTSLGPVNILVAASMLAAACHIAPAWTSTSRFGEWVNLPYGIAYGAALGTILSIHTKALSVFHWGEWAFHDDMAARAAVVQLFAGLMAVVGILWVGWVVDQSGTKGRGLFHGVELGFGVGMSVMSVVMAVGAICMALGRWRKKGVWFVSI